MGITLFTDWFRVRKTLTQETRGQAASQRVDRVMEILPSLLAQCGEGSQARRSVLKIARALVVESPLVYAPCCPDYTHANGRYTFRGLGEGVSLLAERQIRFLEPIAELLPEAQIVLLLADQESEDVEIRQAIGVDKSTFDERIARSLQALQERVHPFGWAARAMTNEVPTLIDEEHRIANELINDPGKSQRLQTEMCQRCTMHDRIRHAMPTEERFRRTVRTAAQYVALGRAALERRALICNHTTTNLSWYNELDVAVLHNPVSVY